MCKNVAADGECVYEYVLGVGGIGNMFTCTISANAFNFGTGQLHYPIAF